MRCWTYERKLSRGCSPSLPTWMPTASCLATSRRVASSTARAKRVLRRPASRRLTRTKQIEQRRRTRQAAGMGRQDLVRLASMGRPCVGCSRAVSSMVGRATLGACADASRARARRQAIAEELGVESIPRPRAGRASTCARARDVLVVARGADGPARRAGCGGDSCRGSRATPSRDRARSMPAPRPLATNRALPRAVRAAPVSGRRRRLLRVAEGRQRARTRTSFACARAGRSCSREYGIGGKPKDRRAARELRDRHLSPPNAVMAPIHDRMPVIVPPSARARVARRATPPSRRLAALLRPYPDDEMEAYPVSRLVNSPRNDEPECIRRLEAPPTA